MTDCYLQPWYSTESFNVKVPRWVVAASELPWIPPSLLCITWLHQPWGTSAQAHLLMTSLKNNKKMIIAWFAAKFSKKSVWVFFVKTANHYIHCTYRCNAWVPLFPLFFSVNCVWWLLWTFSILGMDCLWFHRVDIVTCGVVSTTGMHTLKCLSSHSHLATPLLPPDLGYQAKWQWKWKFTCQRAQNI